MLASEPAFQLKQFLIICYAHDVCAFPRIFIWLNANCCACCPLSKNDGVDVPKTRIGLSLLHGARLAEQRIRKERCSFGKIAFVAIMWGGRVFIARFAIILEAFHTPFIAFHEAVFGLCHLVFNFINVRIQVVRCVDELISFMSPECIMTRQDKVFVHESICLVTPVDEFCMESVLVDGPPSRVHDPAIVMSSNVPTSRGCLALNLVLQQEWCCTCRQIKLEHSRYVVSTIEVT